MPIEIRELTIKTTVVTQAGFPTKSRERDLLEMKQQMMEELKQLINKSAKKMGNKR